MYITGVNQAIGFGCRKLATANGANNSSRYNDLSKYESLDTFHKAYQERKDKKRRKIAGILAASTLATGISIGASASQNNVGFKNEIPHQNIIGISEMIKGDDIQKSKIEKSFTTTKRLPINKKGVQIKEYEPPKRIEAKEKADVKEETIEATEETAEATEQINEQATVEAPKTPETEAITQETKEVETAEPVAVASSTVGQQETARAIEETTYQENKNNYGIDIDTIIDEHRIGRHGDCYLLATLESLNACDGGRKLIRDNVTINENSVSVSFPGINYTSEISFAKLKEARDNGGYSKGDDDVLLFELAIQDAFYKIKNGEIYAPDEIMCSLNDSNDVLYSGYMQDVMYLFTGEMSYATMNNPLLTSMLGFEPDYYEPRFEDRHDNDLNATLDKKMNNPDNVILTLTMKSGPDTYHGWGVISVDGNYITIIDPNNSKTQTLTRQELFERALYFEHCEI